MSEDIDYRLIAYTPFTLDGRRGPLPKSLTWTYTLTRYGIPELTIETTSNTERSEWLEEPCEIAVEVKDADGEYREKDFGRLLVISRSYDRLDRTKLRRYRCIGLGIILARLNINDASTVDPGDGPSIPLRVWNDPDMGNLMVPTFNAAIARRFDPYVNDPPSKHFELSEDGNGVPWVETIPGQVTRRTTDKLMSLEWLGVQTGIAEPRWYKRQYHLLNFGTYGTDLSDSVILRDVHLGGGASPETKDFQDLCGAVLVVGDQGQIYMRENLDADTSYGMWEASTSVNGLVDPDALHKAARELIIAGESENEELTREGTGVADGPKPLRDFHVADSIRVQRDAATGNRYPTLECVELSITRGRGRKIKWHAKFGDRHEDRLLRTIRRNTLLTAGETPSAGGRPNDPTGDPRRPAAPTNVQVVTTTYADDHVPPRTLAEQTITWDAVTLDDQGELINLDGYEIAEQRFGVKAAIVRVGPSTLSWTRKDVLPGTRDLAVRAIGHNLIRSLYSVDVDGDVVREAEPPPGPNQVLDPRWTMASVNTARASNAGAGFAFGTSGGRTRAQFSTTTPTLRTRIGGTNDAGWITVTPGEKILVGGTDRRVGVSAASARYGVQYVDTTGTVIEVDNVVTHTCTASDVRTVAEWTVPSGAVRAAWKSKATGTLSSTVVEIVDPVFDRRTSNERIEDSAVTGGTGTGAKIANRTISAINVVVDSLTANEIAANTITANEIAAGTITATEIAAGAITASKIQADAIDGMTLDGVAVTAVFVVAPSGAFDSLVCGEFGIGAARGAYALPANPTTSEIASLLSAFGLADLF